MTHREHQQVQAVVARMTDAVRAAYDLHWRDYRREVIAPDATPDQLKQLREAFCAGSVVVMEVIAAVAAATDGSDASIDAGAVVMESLRRHILDTRGAV